MSAEPVESQGWWWSRTALVSVLLGAIATGIAFGIRARSYMEETGQGLDLGTIADLVASVIWIWPVAAIIGLLGVIGLRALGSRPISI